MKENSMPERMKIIRTADGSCTLYRQDLDETYHSIHGALAESMHVYIENGLARLALEKDVHILEIGFGTGLNALLTMEHAAEGQNIYYNSIEPFPVDLETINTYYEQFEVKPVDLHSLDKMLATDGTVVELRPGFNFCLLNKTLQSLHANDLGHKRFDLV